LDAGELETFQWTELIVGTIPNVSMYGARGSTGFLETDGIVVVIPHRRDATWGTPWGVSEAGRPVPFTMACPRGDLESSPISPLAETPHGVPRGRLYSGWRRYRVFPWDSRIGHPCLFDNPIG
jgi:hypothetical protein